MQQSGLALLPHGEWRRCSKCIHVYIYTHTNTYTNTYQAECNKVALYFFLMAIGVGAASAIQLYAFGTSGEALGVRIKMLYFKAILRQSMPYFDKEENSSGALTAKLTENVTKVWINVWVCMCVCVCVAL